MTSSPLIIIGAPRSGTSLLQKIIRETPGFCSVPRESQHIWHPYVQPSACDWRGEVVSTDLLEDADELGKIRSRFASEAISFADWQRIAGNPLANHPVVRRIGRLLPAMAVKALSGFKRNSNQPGRLVDKSVHAGLWLPLVDAVFPDAIYVHLVRSPERTIPSMIRGWRDAGRFVSHRVPLDLALSDYAGKRRDWCFPLPVGWQDYANTDLLQVTCFQWRKINRSILAFAEQRRLGPRYVRIRLEDLTNETLSTLAGLSERCGIDHAGWKQRFQDGLPVVNRGSGQRDDAPVDVRKIRALTSQVADLIGYPGDS